MKPASDTINILRGVTWQRVARWLSGDRVHKPVTNIVLGTPTLLTVPAHGITGAETMPVWITDVVGPRQLNNSADGCGTPVWATVVDTNTVSIDVDSGSLQRYVSGGVLTYNLPVDLTLYHATETIQSTPDATTPIIALTDTSGIALGADGTITRTLTAAQTTALALATAWHKLELTAPDGTVTRLLEGAAYVRDSSSLDACA